MRTLRLNSDRGSDRCIQLRSVSTVSADTPPWTRAAEASGWVPVLGEMAVQAKALLKRTRNLMSEPTHGNKTAHSARLSYILWIVLTICALAPLPYFQSLAVGPTVRVGDGSELLPMLASTFDHGSLATMHFLSCLFAFTVAFVILMRFSSLGNHLYLIMGLAFCVVGTEDLLHGLAATTWQGDGAGRTLFVTTTYMTARILLVGFFTYAFLTNRSDRAKRWRTRNEYCN